MTKNLFNTLLLCACIFAIACEKEEPEVIIETVTETIIDTVELSSADDIKEAIPENYADMVYYNYLDAYNTAVELQTAINNFIDAPSAELFETVKIAWLDSREPYGQTEAFRFAGGPIDAEDGPEGLLNAWPLDESYIDYVDGDLSAGIINDLVTYPVLDKALLESLNEAGGEENISIGYHAIEYLLWGQDLTAPSAMEAGKREFTDFTTATNADRRGQYMQICAELILDHLQLMLDDCDPNQSGNYRSTFLALTPDEAITNMLTGIGTLAKSELAGERIFTAYDNKDQEDEHSCFSDNTHRDTRLNAIGIRNVVTGCYLRSDGISKVVGPSLLDLIAVVDPAFGESLDQMMNEALVAVDATAIPFDFAISDDSTRPAVLNSVGELREFGDGIAELGTKLGLSINTELPE
ncbi:MAG: hypothetical protein HRU40_06200 [Saprospiraceae bacterium]|nr:hypothetical protein [Saprospiraceae bacterium]